MSTFSGEQIAQVDNPDPFAPPVWRSPVYHTPGWMITIVQAWRLLAAVIRFSLRHPLLDLAAGRRRAGLAAARLARPGRPGRRRDRGMLALWRWRWPASFSRFIARPGAGQVAALALPAALGRGA